MATKKLTDIVIDALEDIKARDIHLINVSKLTSVFDYIAIASADSSRQTKALAKNVMDKVKESGGWIYGTEGEATGEWVLVDCGDVVVHIMQPVMRELYKLEELWGEGKLEYPKPVAAKRAPVVEEEDAVEVVTPSKKKKAAPKTAKPKVVKAKATAAKAKTTTKAKAKVAAAKPVTKKATAVAKKPAAAKKPAVKKPAAKKPAAKKPVAKKPAAKKPVAKKPAAKKPAVKKPAAKKPAAKKPAVKKPAAKKPAAKKSAARSKTAK